MVGDGYPKRPKFFANRFSRLILRVCAAQQIGSEAVLLCIHVAHTEDVRQYRSPPRFWASELCNVLALSLNRLARSRKKAVESGWLHYEPGNKSTAPVYWVIVPPEWLGVDDKAMGEYPIEGAGHITRQIDEPSAVITRQIDESSGNDPGMIRESSVNDPGVFIPIPNPNPNPKEIHARVELADKTVLVTAFDCFWEACPRKVAKTAARKSWAKAVRCVMSDRHLPKHEAEIWIVDRMAQFAASPKGRGEFCPYPATWLNQGRYYDDPAAWRDSNGKAAARIREDTPVESRQV